MVCLQYMLLEPTQERFEHLVTQMKWRLSESEGVGEAIYEIGGIYTPVGGTWM
jgi:GTPase